MHARALTRLGPGVDFGVVLDRKQALSALLALALFHAAPLVGLCRFGRVCVLSPALFSLLCTVCFERMEREDSWTSLPPTPTRVDIPSELRGVLVSCGPLSSAQS